MSTSIVPATRTRSLSPDEVATMADTDRHTAEQLIAGGLPFELAEGAEAALPVEARSGAARAIPRALAGVGLLFALGAVYRLAAELGWAGSDGAAGAMMDVSGVLLLLGVALAGLPGLLAWWVVRRQRQRAAGLAQARALVAQAQPRGPTAEVARRIRRLRAGVLEARLAGVVQADLLDALAELEAAVGEAGRTPPEVEAALDALAGRLEEAAVATARSTTEDAAKRLAASAAALRQQGG